MFVESIKRALNRAAAMLLAPLRMSRLTARIMAIMVFPLSIFLVGLLSIDQYRTTLIQSEFIALERQGFTLARSLALAEADRDQQFARRRLSAETMTHLLPLVGLGSSLRARVFQPNGLLLADTARPGRLRIPVEVKRREDRSWLGHTRDHLNDAMNKASSFFSFADDLPIYVERRRQRADHFPEVLAALSGEPRRALRQDAGGELVLSVAVPIQDLRLVRGALLVSISGGKIERELANVNIAFLQLFLIVLMVTIGLSLYLARSITRPISRLASAADQLRRSGDTSRRLQQLPQRNDEIGHLSDALLAMTDELQRRIQATAAFAADVAHEIKNPLSSLRSAAETISLIKDPAQQQKLMNVILQDVSRLDRLITDISQASRVDTEIIGQDGEPIDFAALLDNFIQLRRQSFANHKLVLAKPEQPIMVVGQDGRIVQVLDNLLSNAVSFSPKGAEIIFDLSIKDSPAQAVLQILDEGPGIPENRLETVFHRFYSERPKGESFGDHSGLGLSIAKQIIEGHGGSLVASNRDTGGACFTLTLPLA
ncbi:MAG: stimulus-sensing domain-containing protein [Candidatus Puniceispirillaceae bacterium]